jgi:predicted ATP-binding protein involved in virulence
MSEPNNLLRIDRLTLRNFRCFAECSLELHPTLTVLVAENAHGKTALLDALRLALNVFVTTIGRGEQCPGFERTDIHLVQGKITRMEPQTPTMFKAEGYVDGNPVIWSRVREHSGSYGLSSRKEAKPLRVAALKLGDNPDVRQNASVEKPTLLPIVAFYGTGRLWDEHRLTRGKRRLASSSSARISAYLDCLSPSSSYKSFSTWYQRTAESIRNPSYRALGRNERPENYLTAVRNAVRTVLEPTGWTTVDWEFPSKDANGQAIGQGWVVVEHPEEGRLPLSNLSDGVRNMVALVADLAHRCVRLNPHLGETAARETPGILMIDEVDMHLHPRWQQLVVGLLQAAFPKVQMILTTHSPHVLSTVDVKSIRVVHLEKGVGDPREPKIQTQGDESAGVLAKVMDVDPVPDVGPAKLLSHYRELVQKGEDQTHGAEMIWKQLVGHFGAEHHLLQEAEILRRLQQFKRANKLM